MAGKIYTVRPGETLRPSVAMPKRTKKENQEINPKEVIIDFLERGLLLLMLCLLLTISVFLAHKAYRYLMVKIEKKKLVEENELLSSEFLKMTTREVLEEKAKKLGLRPARQNEIIRVP